MNEPVVEVALSPEARREILALKALVRERDREILALKTRLGAAEEVERRQRAFVHALADLTRASS